MELKDFIKESLKSIVGAIEEAQNEIEAGVIVPAVNESQYNNAETGFTSYQKIDFEVLVNAEESKGREGKISVVASVLGAHGKRNNSNIVGHSAKLNFKVPVKLPVKDNNVK